MAWEIFNTIASNLGLSDFGMLALIVFNIAALVFFYDVRIGSMLGMLVNACLFVWFYSVRLTEGYNWGIPLTITFIYLIILSLSLYLTNKSQGAQLI